MLQLEGLDIREARGLLLNIAGSSSMTMDEFDLFNNMNVPTQDNDFEEAEVLTLGEGRVNLPFEEEE